jgi:hypothetical protein
MRRTDHEKHDARGQLLGLVVFIAALAGIALWETRRPADATRLSLPISDLRSQSAELQALAQERDAGHVPPRFLRSQTLQLLENQRDTAEELSALRPWPELTGTQRDAAADADRLQRQLHQLAAGRDVNERDIEALRDRFRGRERALRD